MSAPPAVLDLAQELRARDLAGARVALVLGSGLGDFAERLDPARAVPYGELEHMPQSRVEGHAGELLRGTLSGVEVLVQRGRVHLYEGWSAAEVTRAVRAFAELGCEALVLTNAAGGLRPEWPPGTLMRITDHLNLSGRPPLRPQEAGRGNPWDRELLLALEAAARDSGVPLESGVYAAVLGPAYESPAEIRMIRAAGADAVGMSTAAEATAGHACGLRVAGVSLVTNAAAGLAAEELSHQDVLAAGRAAAPALGQLLAAAIPKIAAALDG